MGKEVKESQVVMRALSTTPELLVRALKKVAVETDGEVLTKVEALEYVLKKFLKEK